MISTGNLACFGSFQDSQRLVAKSCFLMPQRGLWPLWGFCRSGLTSELCYRGSAAARISRITEDYCLRQAVS